MKNFSRTRVYEIGPIVLLTTALSASACGTYGWAERGHPDTRIAVETVQIPPERGIDPDFVTRRLVDTLQRVGWNGAEWSSAANTISLRCQIVDLWEEGYGSVADFRAEIACVVAAHGEENREVRREVSTGSDLRFSPLPNGLREGYQSAALLSVETIAWDISKALEERTAGGET